MLLKAQHSVFPLSTATLTPTQTRGAGGSQARLMALSTISRC